MLGEFPELSKKKMMSVGIEEDAIMKESQAKSWMLQVTCAYMSVSWKPVEPVFHVLEVLRISVLASTW